MILSAHTSNGGPTIARPEPLSTRRMLKILRKRLDKVSSPRLSRKKSGVREVHRLRVATRKAIAALSVCKPLLPKSVRRRIEKSLKGQRRALGTLRDWDVLISKVLCTPANEKVDLRCDLLQYLASERQKVWREARKAWSEATADLDIKKWKPAKTTAGGETAHQLFRRALRKPLTTLREGVPSSNGDGAHNMKALHKFRIACKALRYLLEYRDDVTGPDANNHFPSRAVEVLTEAQQRLGDLHDWSRRPELLRSGRRPSNKAVAKWLQTAAKQAELRLPEEVQRYKSWMVRIDFTDAFRTLDQ